MTALAWSFWYRIEDRIWSEGARLLHEVAALPQAATSQTAITTMHKVVEYLATHRHDRLLTTAQNKMAQLDNKKAVIEGVVTEVAKSALSEERRVWRLHLTSQLLSTDQLLSMNRLQRSAQAILSSKIKLAKQREGVVHPARLQILKEQWNNRSSGRIDKTVNNFVQTAMLAYGIRMERPATTQQQAQTQMTFYRNLLRDVKWLVVAAAVQVVALAWKTVILAGVVIGIGVLAYRQYMQVTLHHLDDSINLNDIVEAGKITPMLGPQEQYKKMKQYLLSGIGQVKPENRLYPLLVGEPGSGKTKMAQTLAWEIVHEKIPALKGKGFKVFAVNTAKLVDGGGWDMDTARYKSPFEYIAQQVKGFENRTILFFDEFHAIAKWSEKSANPTNLDELMKTELMDRGITCVMATTSQEYAKTIGQNQALLQRFETISLQPQNPEDTKEVLKELAREYTEGLFVVENEAIAEVMRVAAELFPKDAEPRRSRKALVKVMSYVKNYTPEKVAEKLRKKEAELNAAVAESAARDSADPYWIGQSGAEGAIGRIDALETELKTIKAEKAQEDALYQEILQLRAQKGVYKLRSVALMQQLENAKLTAARREALQREALFLEFQVLPLLEKAYQAKLKAFGQKFEPIPTAVTQKLVADYFAKDLEEQAKKVEAAKAAPSPAVTADFK